MKKRLRKKKHRGEFTEWGRQLVVTRNRKDGFDEFLDAFIEEAIEANGCYCGGGGKEDKLDVVVELGRRSDVPEARLRCIGAWLDARPDVQTWRTSEEFDLWHGEVVEIAGKTLLAVEFDHRFSYGFHEVYWVQPGNTDDWASEFVTILRDRVQLKIEDPYGSGPKLHTPFRQIPHQPQGSLFRAS